MWYNGGLWRIMGNRTLKEFRIKLFWQKFLIFSHKEIHFEHCSRLNKKTWTFFLCQSSSFEQQSTNKVITLISFSKASSKQLWN